MAKVHDSWEVTGKVGKVISSNLIHREEPSESPRWLWLWLWLCHWEAYYRQDIKVLNVQPSVGITIFSTPDVQMSKVIQTKWYHHIRLKVIFLVYHCNGMKGRDWKQFQEYNIMLHCSPVKYSGPSGAWLSIVQWIHNYAQDCLV